MIAGFIETSDNQTVLLASGLASGKEQRQYMIDGFTATAGPQDLILARSRGGI